MFIRKKRNSSGSISVQILEKVDRKNKLIKTIGSSKEKNEIEILYQEALKLIPQLTSQPQLDLFPNENNENIFDTFVKNLSTNSIVCIGPELIIARLFDSIGFSKDGKFQSPLIMLGLLVVEKGYPIGYDIYEGNSYEGNTFIPKLQKSTLLYNSNIFIFYSIFNFLKVLVLERVLLIINVT